MTGMVVLAVALVASVGWSEPLEWKFPLASHCHEGMAFGDAVTGVLVWGGDDTLNFTVGRSDLWDHRGGYKWTDEQSYSNIVSIVRAGDKERMVSLFKKETPKGEPRNPTILPLGRIVVKMPGAELKRGTLDPFTGQASLFLADGREIKLAMCRGWGGGMFAIKFPEGLERKVSFVHSMEFPNVAKRLVPLGFKPAEKKFLGSEQIGFTWELPADDPVSLGTWCKGKDELCFHTTRSSTCGLCIWSGPIPNYENISKESEGWWRNFWKTAARVTIPDKALQEAYDYGMYRFASMTGVDGVPAGLQGPWIEDDALPPWSGDYHFNINVQECYSPAFRGGHPEHLKPLFAMIKRWHPVLRENAKKFCGIEDGFVLPHSVDDRGTNIGGFWAGTIDHGSAAWVAAMMFKYFTYTRDVEFLKTDAYPFMKGVMNVYRAMMEETADGKLAIPVGPSPEFGAADFHKAIGRNPSFQLAAAHRLARNLIAAAAMLGEKPDPMWIDVEMRLPLCSETKEGIALFEGRTLSESHRHHSHMAGLYPFDVIPMLTDEDLDLVGRTYGQWAKMGTGKWCGWCIPWASILHTHVGDPDMAVSRLHEWLRVYCNAGRGSMCYPNRRIMQMDGQCATVSAILEMLVHEVDGKVDYFRGCPKEWREVRFENVLMPDGTRVSGSRIDGKETITVRPSGAPELPRAAPLDRCAVPPLPEAVENWRNLRFGMFIHWGPVSLSGKEIGWSRGKQTPVEEYDSLYKCFNPVKFNADEWVAAAKAAGMKYVVLTTKHHDGFCLWDTKYTDYNIMNTPFKRDVVKELSDACRRAGIRFGAYYSTCDWHHPDFPVTSPGGRKERARHDLDAYTDYMKNQVRELLVNYGPLLCLWHDVPQKFDVWRGSRIINMERAIQPDILVNNRTRHPGDFDTPEQRIGKFQMERPWETCMTICRQWAWKPDDEMKSLQECVHALMRTVGGDGNFLFNVGPQPDGLIEPRQVARLKEMGDWVSRNAAAVYGTRGGPWKPTKTVVSTRKGDKIYVTFLSKCQEPARLPSIPLAVKSARTLDGKSVKVETSEDSLVVHVPAEAWDGVATVVELTVDGDSMSVPPLSVPTGFEMPGAKASASSVFDKRGVYAAGKAIDGDSETRWATPAGTHKAWLRIDLQKEGTFAGVLMHEECCGSSSRVKRWELQKLEGKEWKTFYTGTAIGSEFKASFAPQKGSSFRINILEAVEGPTFSVVKLLAAP